MMGLLSLEKRNFVPVLYFDHNATTPMAPEVLEAMRPYFLEHFANASSLQHAPGRGAAEAVEQAAAGLAGLLGAEARDLVFTSGATEANNLALIGAMRWWAAQRQPRRHLVVSAIEHHSVLDTARWLEGEGFEVSWARPDFSGVVSTDEIQSLIRPDTALVSVLWANNETGCIQPVVETGRLCREKEIWFHSDATQAVGRIPVNVQEVAVDLLSFSAHKFYGPKGSGALYVRRRNPRVRLEPLLHGGGHQRGLRSGTLNVPGIVGLAAAAQLAVGRMEPEAARLGRLRDLLENRLLAALPMAERLGAAGAGNRLPQTSLIGLKGRDARALMRHLPQLAVGHGAACSEPGMGVSHVLRAMGVPPDLAGGAIRFSLGLQNSESQVLQAVEMLAEAVRSSSADSEVCGV